MINILLVEDNEIVRTTMAMLLGDEDGIVVTGAAEDGISALEILEKGSLPDIVLADLNMPRMDGIELTRMIGLNYVNLPVVILTMHNKVAFAEKAFAAGAKGYLLKDGDMKKLCLSITEVYNGGTVLDDQISK